MVFEGVGFEPGGELEDFGVGYTGVGFAYVEEFAVRVLDGEGVVAEQTGALAVPVLGTGDDYVEGGQFALEFDPGEAAAAGLVG